MNCQIKDCINVYHARGYCHSHYKKEYLFKTEPSIACKYAGCGKRHCARGYCANHYRTQYLWKEVKPLWKTWQGMKQRCYNENDRRYKDWGGRGIKVCDEWLSDYEAFAEYMGTRPTGHQLDRIDNDGDYAPGNVRWATPSENASNRKRG